MGPDEVNELLGRVDTVLLARGKKLLEFSPATDRDEILEKAIGRSGNLRAPTLRSGKTLVVGFHPEAYASLN